MVSYLVPIRHEQIVLVLERSVSRSKLIEGPNTSPSTVGAGLGVKGKPKPSDMCVSKRYSNYCLFLTPKINTLRSRSARNTNPGRMVSPPLLNVRVFYSVQFVVVFGPDQSANLCDCYLFFRHPFRMVTVNPPSTFLAYSPLNYCYTGVVPPTHILQGWKTHRQPIVNMYADSWSLHKIWIWVDGSRSMDEPCLRWRIYYNFDHLTQVQKNLYFGNEGLSLHRISPQNI